MLTSVFLAAAALAVQARAAEIPAGCRTDGWAVGCQAWSFNRFTAYEAVEKTAEAGGKVIEFYPGQALKPGDPEAKLVHGMPEDTIVALQDHLKRHGVTAVNYGVVWLPNEEKECRAVFGFARRMGLYAVTSEPDPKAMDLIERLAGEYDIRVGLHNHPRKADDPGYRYWDPAYVLSLVRGRDARLGSCADTGHWVRSGIKPVEALRTLKGRIVSSHLKDLSAFSPDAHDVPYGTGASDLPGILRELRRQGFAGNLSVEYEHDEEKSVPAVAQCIGFVRGWGARGER